MTGSTKSLQLSLIDEMTRGKVADQPSSVGRHLTGVEDHLAQPLRVCLGTIEVGCCLV
jgi:hypothetical protein